jgi:hypothetical protein
MPAFIAFGVINSNTPQQNSGIFIGEINITGWDANQKMNLGHGATFGTFVVEGGTFNYTFDGFELLDTMVNDQDLKASWNVNI